MVIQGMKMMKMMELQGVFGKKAYYFQLEISSDLQHAVIDCACILPLLDKIFLCNPFVRDVAEKIFRWWSFKSLSCFSGLLSFVIVL